MGFFFTNARCASGIPIPSSMESPFPHPDSLYGRTKVVSWCHNQIFSRRFHRFPVSNDGLHVMYGGNVSGQQQKHFSPLGSELHSSKKIIAPAGISPGGEIPRRHPSKYIKDRTYSSNIQSVY